MNTQARRKFQLCHWEAKPLSRMNYPPRESF